MIDKKHINEIRPEAWKSFAIFMNFQNQIACDRLNQIWSLHELLWFEFNLKLSLSRLHIPSCPVESPPHWFHGHVEGYPQCNAHCTTCVGHTRQHQNCPSMRSHWQVEYDSQDWVFDCGEHSEQKTVHGQRFCNLKQVSYLANRH